MRGFLVPETCPREETGDTGGRYIGTYFYSCATNPTGHRLCMMNSFPPGTYSNEVEIQLPTGRDVSDGIGIQSKLTHYFSFLCWLPYSDFLLSPT